MKVQKELKYPRVGFDWKSAFLQCLDNAYIEKGKIKVFIDDPNVAIEVKHAIEINGGFTDSSFNSKICIIGPADFLDLLCITCPEKKPEEIKKKIIKTIEKNNDALKFIESETLAVQIKKAGIELGFDILDGVLKTVPVIGNVLPNLREQITNIAGNKINARKVQKQMKSKKRGE